MLKRDREAFLELVTGKPQRAALAVTYFSALERGHFEDHPLSRKLVQEHLDALVAVWNANNVTGARDWVLQFIADAQVASQKTKPLVISALSDPSCSFLPTVLYLMGTMPDLFTDAGPLLKALARHTDREVRWRVAWLISNFRHMDSDMTATIALLEQDPDHTTQVYVRACRAKT